MEMIPQGTKLYAVAVQYVRGTEPDSMEETAVSFGVVVAWQSHPETEENSARPVLVPVVAWIDGPAVTPDGTVGAATLSLDPITSAIMFGERLMDAAKAVDLVVAERLPAWRLGYKTVGTYAAAHQGASVPERASQTAARRQRTGRSVVDAFVVGPADLWPFPRRYDTPFAFRIEVETIDGDGIHHHPPFSEEIDPDTGLLHQVDVRPTSMVASWPTPLQFVIRRKEQP